MTATPMMRQYQDAKAACSDALLLFRMGDFYELFHDDAKRAAQVLNLALTSREKGENAIPMAGFPYHQLDTYLGKLIAAGLRVAICDQVEDPKQAKGLVRRELTRIVTRGTITDDALLDPRENNFLAALVPGPLVGLAWVELSTGCFHATQLAADRLADELARIAPVECLLAEDAEPPAHVLADGMAVTRRPNWVFAQHAAHETLARHFGTATLEGFGFSESDAAAIRAAGAVLEYLLETQKTSIEHVDRLIPYRQGTVLEIDEASRRSLEISRNLRDGQRDGSLLGVLDRTVTAMGSRLLSRMGCQPAYRHWRNQRPPRRCGRATGRCGLVYWLARHAQEHLRHRAAARPRDHRPRQPARSELPGPHATRAAGVEGPAHRPQERSFEWTGGGA